MGLHDMSRQMVNIVGLIITILGFTSLMWPGTFGFSEVAGLGLIFVGTVLFAGIPSPNFMVNKVKTYGTPFLLFITGLLIFFLKYYGTDVFFDYVVRYALFGFITTGIFYFLNQLYPSLDE